MCLGSSKAPSTTPPPPGKPTTFGDAPMTDQQRMASQQVANVNAPLVMSSSNDQLKAPASYGSELGKP